MLLLIFLVKVRGLLEYSKEIRWEFLGDYFEGGLGKRTNCNGLKMLAP
jgi:hypothetical protein